MPLPVLFRFIKIAKVTALVADILTAMYVVSIVGWQLISLLKAGRWPGLPLSTVVSGLRFNQDAIYAAASQTIIEKNKASDLIDTMLRIPAILPLLLAVALLTAYYLWLINLEKNLQD